MTKLKTELILGPCPLGAQTRDQDHCLTEIDDAGNDHVNEQGMNQVDDTYYTEIFASDELTYAKVNKQAKW